MSDAQGQRTPPDGTRAHIGSFTSAGGHGITTAAVDPHTGALTPLHRTGSAVPDPSYLTVGGGVLHAVSEREDGAAAAFSLADPDRPRLLGEPVPVGGAGPTHLCVTDGRLFTAHYGSGSVSALAVRADGTLGGRPVVHRHEGRGPDPDRQEGPHAHAVVPDPTGRRLLATDLGTDEVRVYDLRSEDGGPVFRPHGLLRVRPGTGPRHLLFHPDGQRAYLVGELNSLVTACRWDAETGTLEPLAETSTRGPVPPGGENYPSALVLSPDGRFLWIANRGDDTVAVFALDEEGGGMEAVTTVPCGGHWPRDLALHPSGRWLYVAGERSGDVTWFSVDPATGVPHREGSVPAPAASCVAFG
ncbi:lactonase family protein [Streptomyces sp. HNM0574]|uniref:beta-propeller fold lactonase family protein n=1 Tax=Streptomyces sp. HNM0574 TaxID=2714954 RepID=UPI00146B2308|nr:lactonase family protein [Streptomyces sp. HNM0574]